MKKYDPVDVAKYIVNKCFVEEEPVSNFSLQYILYETQLSFIKHCGEPLIDGYFEAWPFSPVLPAVYYRFGGCGAMPITFPFPAAGQTIRSKHKKLIDAVTEDLRKMSPYALSLRKKYYRAWEKTYDDRRGIKQIIPVKMMMKDVKEGYYDE